MQYGIIFDCDGTLVNSLWQAVDSFNYALEQLGEPPRAPEDIKRYFGGGADRIFMNLLGDEKRALIAFDHYMDHQSGLAERTSLHEGVRELLETLAERDVPMGVVTGRHARDLEIVLRPHKISEYFKVLIADSHLPKSKPAPDGILMACEHMRLDPRHALYVGDSIVDVQAALASGVTPVAALWDSLADREAMQKAGAKHFATHPRDALSALDAVSSS